MSMDDIEPSVLTYTAFRNRQVLEAWRRRQSEYDAQRERARELDTYLEEEEQEVPPPLLRI